MQPGTTFVTPRGAWPHFRTALRTEILLGVNRLAAARAEGCVDGKLTVTVWTECTVNIGSCLQLEFVLYRFNSSLMCCFHRITLGKAVAGQHPTVASGPDGCEEVGAKAASRRHELYMVTKRDEREAVEYDRHHNQHNTNHYE